MILSNCQNIAHREAFLRKDFLIPKPFPLTYPQESADDFLLWMGNMFYLHISGDAS